MQTVFTRYWEGSNRTVAVLAPAALAAALVKYDQIAAIIDPYKVDQQLLYSYTLNVCAIALGALLSLFALLASRPTEFLVRIRNTVTFKLLINNIKATTVVCAIVTFFTFFIGVLNVEPDNHLTNKSCAFVLWAVAAISNFGLIYRTVRASFTALTTPS